MGPAEPHSTVLSIEHEAMIVAFRRHSLLPLDDCLYALQPTIPGLTRSSLHRCLQRHGISRLPDMDGEAPARKKFKAYPIGFFHVHCPAVVCEQTTRGDIAEVRSGEGKLYMFVAIDRTSKFAIVRLYEQADRPTAVIFLEAVLEAVPYKINIILPPSHGLQANRCRATDNGIQFAEQPRNRNTVISRLSRFDMICTANEIEHRLTKPNHPWTNGQVERMNRTIKEATVKRYHYDDHEQVRRHLDLFIDTYNHARRLKALKGLTPAQFIWKEWQARPELFYEEPCYLTSGLYT
jgi:transposase InsO family protein